MYIDIVIFKKETKGFKIVSVVSYENYSHLLAQTADDACRSLGAGN